MSSNTPQSDPVEITVMVQGGDNTNRKVKFDSFVRYLNQVLACLKDVERVLSLPGPKLTYVVEDLHSGSAYVGVGATKPRKGIDKRPAVFGGFNQVVRSFSNPQSREPIRADRKMLKSFQKLGKLAVTPEAENNRNTLSINGVSIDVHFLSAVSKQLESTERSWGSVTGRIDGVHEHTANKCELYASPRYEHAVACTFIDELRDEIIDAMKLKRTVTVYGECHYSADAAFPVRMRVTEIELHPTMSAIPRASDMLGICDPPIQLNDDAWGAL